MHNSQIHSCSPAAIYGSEPVEVSIDSHKSVPQIKGVKKVICHPATVRSGLAIGGTMFSIGLLIGLVLMVLPMSLTPVLLGLCLGWMLSGALVMALNTYGAYHCDRRDQIQQLPPPMKDRLPPTSVYRNDRPYLDSLSSPAMNGAAASTSLPRFHQVTPSEFSCPPQKQAEQVFPNQDYFNDLPPRSLKPASSRLFFLPSPKPQEQMMSHEFMGYLQGDTLIASTFKYPARSLAGMKLELTNTQSNEIEERHNFIQTLFPTRFKSENQAAPFILDSVTKIDLMRADQKVKAHLFESTILMMFYYGFDYDSSSYGQFVRILDPNSWQKQGYKNLFSYSDHNHLRLTRILCCLRLLDMDDLANAVLNAVEKDIKIAQVNQKTRNFWRWHAINEQCYVQNCRAQQIDILSTGRIARQQGIPDYQHDGIVPDRS